MSENSKGAIQMIIGLSDDHVVIAFSESTKWVGLDYETAMNLGNSIIDMAKNIINKGH